MEDDCHVLQCSSGEGCCKTRGGTSKNMRGSGDGSNGFERNRACHSVGDIRMPEKLGSHRLSEGFQENHHLPPRLKRGVLAVVRILSRERERETGVVPRTMTHRYQLHSVDAAIVVLGILVG